MMNRIFRKEKTLAELEEETEHKEAENKLAGLEYSLAQKKQMAAELKERGLTPKHFGFDWNKIYQWIKSH